MTAASSQPVRGSRFPTLEKYDVLEELGHGGMATVYRARDLRLGRDVAVKVIHPHLRDSVDAVRRFSIEARAVAKLKHANIVEVYDVSAPSDDEQYLVVELLRGATLRRLLEQHGALPAEVAASLGVELLGALGHAHDAGVIHRDVKPENVILEHRLPKATPSDGGSLLPEEKTSRLRSDEKPSGSFKTDASSHPSSDSPGDRISVKLTDFGIAKLLGRAGGHLDGAGPRQPGAHGPGADRRSRGGRACRRLRYGSSPLRMHGRSPPVPRDKPRADAETRARRAVPERRARAPDGGARLGVGSSTRRSHPTWPSATRARP